MAKLSKNSGVLGGDFQPCPEGDYQGVVCGVVDLGFLEKTFGGQSQGLRPHVQLVYQIGGLDEDGEPIEREDGKPWLVFGRRFLLSTNERAGFYKELCAILGKKACDLLLESGELDTEELVGKNVNLVVTHRQWEGKTFAGVEPIKPWNPRHGQPIGVRDYTRRHQSDRWVEPQFSAFGPGPQTPPAPLPPAQAPAPRAPAPSPSASVQSAPGRARRGVPSPEPRGVLEPVDLPVAAGVQGQIKTLARRKLENDGLALDELCRARFGKGFARLGQDEGAQLLDALRRSKDFVSEEEEDDDIFADE